jgi:hypothetical protein
VLLFYIALTLRLQDELSLKGILVFYVLAEANGILFCFLTG